MKILPTVNEINVFNTPDELYACDQFLGKDLVEAEALFRENALLYSESLMHMGPSAALFYGSALVSYVRSSNSRGDIEAASSLISVVEVWLYAGMDLSAIENDLLHSMQDIHDRFAFYAVDEISRQIYRDVPRKARKAIDKLRLQATT
jgi:hypothetical protein